MKLGSPEYESLKNFFKAVTPVLFPQAIDSDVGPIRALEHIERKMPAKASKSLRMGVNDMLTMLSRIPSEKIKELNAALVDSGCITVGEAMRTAYSDRLPRLLARKSIRGEVDYYFLKSIVEDSPTLLGPVNTEAAIVLLNDFEKRAAKAGRRRKKRSD